MRWRCFQRVSDGDKRDGDVTNTMVMVGRVSDGNEALGMVTKTMTQEMGNAMAVVTDAMAVQ